MVAKRKWKRAFDEGVAYYTLGPFMVCRVRFGRRPTRALYPTRKRVASGLEDGWKVVHVASGLGAQRGLPYKRLKDARSLVEGYLAIEGAEAFLERYYRDNVLDMDCPAYAAMLSLARKHRSEHP